MRKIKSKTIADFLIDRRKRFGMLEHKAIQLYDAKERIVLAEINQGLPESEYGNTGHVGQEEEELEDEGGKANKKENSRPSVAHDG